MEMHIFTTTSPDTYAHSHFLSEPDFLISPYNTDFGLAVGYFCCIAIDTGRGVPEPFVLFTFNVFAVHIAHLLFVCFFSNSFLLIPLYSVDMRILGYKWRRIKKIRSASNF